jgi:hypothetical protein
MPLPKFIDTQRDISKRHNKNCIIAYRSVFCKFWLVTCKTIRFWLAMDTSGEFWRLLAHSGVFWPKVLAGKKKETSSIPVLDCL